MNEHIKVILYAYPKLTETAEGVRAGAYNKAVLSYRTQADTEKIAEKIAEEIMLSQALLDLKDLTEEFINTLDKGERFLLGYKYFRKRVKGGEGTLDYSERNYYRKQVQLFQKACAFFLARGMDEAAFNESFSSFNYFMRAKRALERGLEHSVSGKRKKSGLHFQKSDSSSFVSRRLPCRKTKNAMATAATQAMQMTTICTAESPPPPSLAVGSVLSTGSGR